MTDTIFIQGLMLGALIICLLYALEDEIWSVIIIIALFYMLFS
jgi:hypothetical protein